MNENIEELERTRLLDFYDRALNCFFKEVNLKPNLEKLIRAFIEVSKGEKQFEASFKELTNIIFKSNSQDFDNHYGRVQNWCKKSLMNWQEKNSLELIRVIEAGHMKKPEKDGKFKYFKTKYEFVVLHDLLIVIESNPDQDLEQAIQEFIAKARENYVPPEKKWLSSKIQIDRAVKNISTKLERIFELSIKLHSNPVEYCKNVLNLALMKLEELEKDWIKKQNRLWLFKRHQSTRRNGQNLRLCRRRNPLALHGRIPVNQR